MSQVASIVKEHAGSFLLLSNAWNAFNGGMPFYKRPELESQQLLPGFEVRFVHGASMTLAYWDVEKGAKLPEHSHPHEQICNVIRGAFELVIDGKAVVLEAGDVGVIPSNAIHSGTAMSDCYIIDAFCPVREDYR